MPFLLPAVTGPPHFYTKSSCHRIDRNLGNRVDKTPYNTGDLATPAFIISDCILYPSELIFPSSQQLGNAEFVKHCELYVATMVTAPGPPTTTDLLLLLPSLLNENVLLFSQVKILWKH